jgi:alpha-L-fucosidase 2
MLTVSKRSQTTVTSSEVRDGLPDWEKRTLFFRKEAESWDEAIPIGCGTMGAMVFGGVANERIQLNEDSVWSGGPQDRTNKLFKEHLEKVRSLLFAGQVSEAERIVNRYFFASPSAMRHFQTLGDAWIRFTDMQGEKRIIRDEFQNPVLVEEAPQPRDYFRALDATLAVGNISYTVDNNRFKRFFFASHPAQCIVYRIESEGQSAINFELSLTRKDNRHCRCLSYCDTVAAVDDATMYLEGVNGGAGGIKFDLAARVLTEGGNVCCTGSKLVVEGATCTTVLLTARTSFRSDDPLAWCIETLDAASRVSSADLLAEHVRDYQKLFNRFSISLGDDLSELGQLSTDEQLDLVRKGTVPPSFVANYVDYGRYLFISSVRSGSLPPTLQGVWNEDFEPAWGSRYTININIEMLYWLAGPTGISELDLPLFDHLERMLPRGKKVAEEMYGVDGFCCHHNTDIWGDCAPQDLHCNASVWPMGGAWLCLQMIDHWRYTNDRRVAQRYYHILRKCVAFFIGYAVEDDTGHFVTGPSCSPENIYITRDGDFGSLCMGPTMDTELLHDVLDGYLELSGALGYEDATVSDARRLKEGLRQLTIGGDGRLMEWPEDYGELDPSHRHIAHAFALFPSQQIRKDKTPELARAIEKTIDRRLQGEKSYAGWSKAWMGSMFARLGDGRRAWESICSLFEESTLPNLFDTCPPFQLDANIGASRAILEMCVQDYGDTVILLPAIPDALRSGSICGFQLKAGGTLDVTWKGGVVTKAVFSATREGKVVFRISADRPDMELEYSAGEIISLV